MSAIKYSKLAHDIISGDWNVEDTWDQADRALLRDIAISLRAIRATLDCPNTVEIPEILRSIRRNTTKPKKKVAKKRRAKR